MKKIGLGILGAGTVGSGVVKVLLRNQIEISRRIGCVFEIKMIAARNISKARKILGNEFEIEKDTSKVVLNPEVDVVVELIGGVDQALELVMLALENGKHVVTANKALLALHGNEILGFAKKQNCIVAFEGAIAGGIPIVKALREGLGANRIEWVAGIINGTTNFILSDMLATGMSFDTSLKRAIDLGYAEADPTFDIEGIDAAHKLCLMASLAFGVQIQFKNVFVEGISTLSEKDVRYAGEFGYVIKLLGITKKSERGIELRVHPTLIPSNSSLANVNGPMNAVLVKGDAVGPTMYYGAGAGSEPTASAVIADLLDIARVINLDVENFVPYLGFKEDTLSSEIALKMGQVSTRYYLRIKVEDKPGVIAEISGVLANLSISIEAMLQREEGKFDLSEDSRIKQGLVDIIIITHMAFEKEIDQAIGRITGLSSVHGDVKRLRIETLAEDLNC